MDYYMKLEAGLDCNNNNQQNTNYNVSGRIILVRYVGIK